MSKQVVRISEDYFKQNMAGIEAIIINEGRLIGGAYLVGFPLDSPLGWYDSDYTKEYRCWWIAKEYLEPITTITRSKFK